MTLDGDCLSADGVLTGGATDSADSGLLKRRREIKELSQQREEWAGKLALVKLSLEKLEARAPNDYSCEPTRRALHTVLTAVKLVERTTSLLAVGCEASWYSREVMIVRISRRTS